MADIVIWNAIGAKRFCSFKKKITDNTFCRNKHNISGLCSRQACPLANSKYATILEEEGKLYLYMKTPERAHTPKDMWERIPLHPNFFRALAQVSKYLQFWPRFIRKKAKQRLTKLHQYLIRLRRLRSKVQPELVAVKRKEKKQEQRREAKAHRAAHLQDSIRTELLQRLRQGTYGELYDDIVNFAQQEFEDVLENEAEDDEFNWLEDSQFVEAYSDEEEEDEDDENEYEYEYEIESDRQRQREKAQAGGDYSDDDDGDFASYQSSGVNNNDDDSDDDYDDDDDASSFLGEDSLLEAFDDDDDDDDDDDNDIEDSAPDFQQIAQKNRDYAAAIAASKSSAKLGAKSRPRPSSSHLPALSDNLTAKPKPKVVAAVGTTKVASGKKASTAAVVTKTKPATGVKASSFADRARARQSGGRSRRSIDDDE